MLTWQFQIGLFKYCRKVMFLGGCRLELGIEQWQLVGWESLKSSCRPLADVLISKQV